MSIRVLLATVLFFSILAPALAQTPPAAVEIEGGTPAYIKEETPEQRRERVGEVDPGLNPDPEKVFSRKGVKWKLERYERQWAAYDRGEGMVRPMAMVNFAFEIYQQNEKYVWVWMPTIEEMRDAQNAPVVDDSLNTRFTAPQLDYLRRIAPEFTELDMKQSPKTVRFDDSSAGLPTQGSWRNSAAIADMNGDGHLDIVAPPERGTRSVRPAIFLGDGKGNWTPWEAAVWPYLVQYGNVVAADFNRDKLMDLAFGQHLSGPRVLLGDGKGRFTDSSSGLADGPVFPTRRVVASDVDGDGDHDLLAIYEGPTPGINVQGSKIRAYINEGKGAKWRATDAAGAEDLVYGDWLAVGKFNNDKYPDFVSSNHYFQRPETLFQSTGAGKWKVVDWQDGALVPYLSIYNAVATGRLGSKNFDDALVAYQRSWPNEVDQNVVKDPPLKAIIGVDRISFAGKKPVRTPVARFAGNRPIGGVAVADFDGDGKNDVLFTRHDPREAVLMLGDGKGGFAQATVEGLELAENPNYDINVADANGDGRPDVLLMFESTSDSPFGNQNGSVRLFLNRGAGK